MDMRTWVEQLSAQRDGQGRYGLEDQALDAWQLLTTYYKQDGRFYEELVRLADTEPPIPPSKLPPAPDLLDLFFEAPVAGEGLARGVQFYQDIWRWAEEGLGRASPWLRAVIDVAREWGLATAPWGPGWVVGMVRAVGDHLQRIRPALEDTWERGGRFPPRLWYWMDWPWGFRQAIWESPPVAPQPEPGMTRKQWREAVRAYETAGLEYLDRVREQAARAGA